jgi:hypothetical protein
MRVPFPGQDARRFAETPLFAEGDPGRPGPVGQAPSGAQPLQGYPQAVNRIRIGQGHSSLAGRNKIKITPMPMERLGKPHAN